MGCMRESVATFFADLNLAVDEWNTAATWAEMQTGSRADVVDGSVVVLADGDDAFAATVPKVTAMGSWVTVNWEQPVPVPAPIRPPYSRWCWGNE